MLITKQAHTKLAKLAAKHFVETVIRGNAGKSRSEITAIIDKRIADAIEMAFLASEAA